MKNFPMMDIEISSHSSQNPLCTCVFVAIVLSVIRLPPVRFKLGTSLLQTPH